MTPDFRWQVFQQQISAVWPVKCLAPTLTLNKGDDAKCKMKKMDEARATRTDGESCCVPPLGDNATRRKEAIDRKVPKIIKGGKSQMRLVGNEGHDCLLCRTPQINRHINTAGPCGLCQLRTLDRVSQELF